MKFLNIVVHIQINKGGRYFKITENPYPNFKTVLKLFSLKIEGFFYNFQGCMGCKIDYPSGTDDFKDPLQGIEPRKLSKKSV